MDSSVSVLCVCVCVTEIYSLRVLGNLLTLICYVLTDIITLGVNIKSAGTIINLAVNAHVTKEDFPVLDVYHI